jgi:endonuclease/exonuclease/phosphatase family metal-dependent hydrolase
MFTSRLYATAWADSADVEIPEWHTRADGAAPASVPRDGRLIAAARDDELPPTGEGVVRIATYNVEHMNKMFDQHLLPERSRERTEMWRDEEDQYEVAQVLKLMDADIVGLQECCGREMLEAFNERWLGGMYEFVHVFPSNTEGQWLGMLAKPGFTPVEVREAYLKDVDPVRDPALAGAKKHYGIAEDNLLFSRGPGFVKFATPGGDEVWVGVTHVKSKYGNNEAVTKWRIRELERTRAICGELAVAGPEHVVMLGDFNDDFGKDRHEEALGRDAVATMVQGEGREKLVCLSQSLAEADPKLATYHCELKPPTYRSFIDHIFVTPSAAEVAENTRVVRPPVAAVASDHYPVVTDLKLSGE